MAEAPSVLYTTLNSCSASIDRYTLFLLVSIPLTP